VRKLRFLKMNLRLQKRRSHGFGAMKIRMRAEVREVVGMVGISRGGDEDKFRKVWMLFY
jgi:hypothetical protein